MAAAVLAAAVWPAVAAPTVRVTVTGEVQSNNLGSWTIFGGLGPGTPVELEIALDPLDYRDDGYTINLQRGYRFQPDDMTLRVGAASTSLAPGNDAYFYIHNNWSGGDGFYIARLLTLYPISGVPLASPSGYLLYFERDFDSPGSSSSDDTTLLTVDLFDAIGSWGLDNLGDHRFTVEYAFSSKLIVAYRAISIAMIEPCPACAADYDQDGGVTNGDLAAFFSDFQIGSPCADVDLDGGVTGGDIATFFADFEAGGC